MELHWLLYGFKRMLRWLYWQCCTSYTTELLYAVQGTDARYINALIQAQPHSIWDANKDNGCYTPLQYVLKDNNSIALECLLQAGVDKEPTGAKRTALHLAVEIGNEALVSRLVHRQNIAVNNVDWNQNTPLHCAVYRMDHRWPRSHTPSILNTILMEPTLNINAMNKRGQTALHLAVECICLASVHRLLAHPDINVRLRDLDDFTALARAACLQDHADARAIFEVLANHPANRDRQPHGLLQNKRILWTAALVAMQQNTIQNMQYFPWTLRGHHAAFVVRHADLNIEYWRQVEPEHLIFLQQLSKTLTLKFSTEILQARLAVRDEDERSALWHVCLSNFQLLPTLLKLNLHLHDVHADRDGLRPIDVVPPWLYERLFLPSHYSIHTHGRFTRECQAAVVCILLCLRRRSLQLPLELIDRVLAFWTAEDTLVLQWPDMPQIHERLSP